jgi:hypothetical protein
MGQPSYLSISTTDHSCLSQGDSHLIFPSVQQTIHVYPRGTAIFSFHQYNRPFTFNPGGQPSYLSISTTDHSRLSQGDSHLIFPSVKQIIHVYPRGTAIFSFRQYNRPFTFNPGEQPSYLSISTTDHSRLSQEVPLYLTATVEVGKISTNSRKKP